MKKPWHRPDINSIFIAATAGSGKQIGAGTTENHAGGPVHTVGGPSSSCVGASNQISGVPSRTGAQVFVPGCEFGPS